jgi:DEAD/DEAH box helicase domain-containing protein
MDTLVFDIETQNFFTDPEVGKDNFPALKISAVGVYSYLYDSYWCFEESEIEKAGEIFEGSRCIVGFSINRYDVPVLNNYFGRLPGEKRINLWEKERIDLLEEIEMETGQRIGLSKLAEVNLGIKKERHGSEAIGMYKRGEIEELKKYCLTDVRLTKELYDLYRHRKYFLLPDKKTGEIIKVNFSKSATSATLF